MRNLLLFASAAALTACGSISGAATGGHGTRSFALSGFDAVRLSGSDDVRVVRGTSFSIVATGPNEVLDRLDIKTEGKTLVVTRKRNGSWGWSRDSEGATVTVTMPSIRAAQVAGSGDMSVDRADGPAFKGGVNGSGNLDLPSVNAAAVELDVTGSGDLRAKGRARTAALSVTGSGDLDAAGLTADIAKVAIQGSGDINANARQSASINIAGSGDATVSGTRNCTISKAGSGEANCTG